MISKYLGMAKTAILAVLTLGVSLLVVSRKNAIKKADKLEKENGELRSIAASAILERKAADNYAKHREEQLRQERLEREKIQEVINENKDAADWFNTNIPDSLRKSGL